MWLEGCAIAPGTGHAEGRALLARMYQRHCSTPMPPILIGRRGKPYFASGDYHFSISHCRNHVFCALSDRPIGIDAEEIHREISQKLAEKILSPGELAQYEAADDKRLALLKFWVLKEAQAKFTGQGLTGYPNHTDFSLDDPRLFTLEGCLVAVIQE